MIKSKKALIALQKYIELKERNLKYYELMHETEIEFLKHLLELCESHSENKDSNSEESIELEFIQMKLMLVRYNTMRRKNRKYLVELQMEEQYSLENLMSWYNVYGNKNE